VNNPAQAVEMFDDITYKKGEAVLRMLESFIGNEKFQQGIRKYLQEHSFGNARAEDLWNAIAVEAAGVPVAGIMRSFVYQPGCPQVNVKVTDSGKKMSFLQYRQLCLNQDKRDPSLWLVPLVLRGLGGDGNGPDTNKLLCLREQQFAINSAGQPFFVNSGGKGYFRTCYEPKQLKALQDKFSQLSPEEKLVLLSDCESLVLPGDVPVEDIYNFVHKIKGETDPLILAYLVGIMEREDPYVAGSARKDYERLIQHTLFPLRDKLDGWNQKPGESLHTKQLRALILRQLGTYGQDKRTIGEAYVMFAKYVNDRSAVNPDLVGAMFAIIAFNGGAKEYSDMLQLFKTAKNPADAENALYYLSGFHQAALVQRSLALGMSKDLKQMDGIGLICGVAHNRYTRDIGWAFVKQHWAEILHKFPPKSLRWLAGLSDAFDTAEREKEFIGWYANHPVPYAKSQIARSLESMHTRVLYRQRYADRICKWIVSEAAKIPGGR
jgi:aminopeptidase N